MKIPFLPFRAGVVALLLAAGGFVLTGTAGPAANVTLARHPVLLIDRQAIMTGSKLGQDIHRQVMAYVNKMQSDFGPQGQALQTEMQTLQTQGASMPAAERDKRMQALQAKQAAYREKAQARQNLIQGGELVARQRYLAEVAAVVEAVMQERGADVVVEKSTIVASVGGLDITQTVIQRLDSKMTSFKVPLVNPSPSEATTFLH
ncbi:MAG TPA: OmpH family outer membrane protein [Rhizomicrobium sp.]|jgi:outer membrane protein|nr:OmpH family outer membrane protein [Rhizomicrobium sp.]